MRDSQKGRKPELKKAFGQHHLRHPELCGELLAFLRLEGSTVVEIGPGGGVLTAMLAERASRVWAIELDPAWAFHLAPRVPHDGRATGQVGLVIGDALDFPWERLPTGTRVTGNLPYSVSTVLIEQLVAQSPRLGRQAYLVQLEVAQRLCAGPSEAPYGSLSVIVASLMHCRLLNRVKPGSFSPPPRVDSAFIGLEAREPVVDMVHWTEFKQLVRLAFSKRRKTILNSLSSGLDRDKAAGLLDRASIEPRRRAETVSLEEFVALFEAFRTAAD